jgi:hypothetical protein
VDILFFERMRIIRGDAGKVIFKLRLPKLNGEDNSCFNSFYAMLASAYIEAAEETAKDVDTEVRFTVSFSVGGEDTKRLKFGRKRKGKGETIPLPIVEIRRTATVKYGENERIFAATDVYDPNIDIFTK